MYLTPLSFPTVYKWFQEESYFDYLCLFVSSYNTKDSAIVDEIYRHKIQIDKITGPDICFLYFTPEPIVPDKNNREFMLYHVNEVRRNQALRELGFGDLNLGVGLEANMEVADDVCKTLHILHADLPAFIFIEKGKIYSELVYTVKDYNDFDRLLMPINAINSFISDLDSLDSLLHTIEYKIEPLLNRIESIRKELQILSEPISEKSLEEVLAECLSVLEKKGASEKLINEIRQKPFRIRKLTFAEFPDLSSDKDFSKMMKRWRKALKSTFGNRVEHRRKLENAYKRYMKECGQFLTREEIDEIKQTAPLKRTVSKERFTKELFGCIDLDSKKVEEMMSEIQITRKISTAMLKDILTHLRLPKSESPDSCKVFIAGAKSLYEQRNLLRAALMEIQTLWNTVFQVKTFEDFPRSIIDDGRQAHDYNRYIADEADVIVFVVDKSVGSITLEEFDIAYESYLKKGDHYPEIFVYCYDTNNGEFPEVDKFKQRMDEIHQYYIGYLNNEHLYKEFKDDMNRFLVERMKCRSK